MQLVRCPICEKSFQPEQSQALPFCGERCRRIDMGRWLDERYTMPIERATDAEESDVPRSVEE